MVSNKLAFDKSKINADGDFTAETYRSVLMRWLKSKFTRSNCVTEFFKKTFSYVIQSI